jgi:hypothetical protein
MPSLLSHTQLTLKDIKDSIFYIHSTACLDTSNQGRIFIFFKGGVEEFLVGWVQGTTERASPYEKFL